MGGSHLDDMIAERRRQGQLLHDGYILQEDRDLYIIEAGGDPGKKGHP
jgi:hypothetical protein